MKHLLYKEIIEEDIVDIYTDRYTWTKKRDISKKLNSKINRLIDLELLFFTLIVYMFLLKLQFHFYWSYIVGLIFIASFVINGIIIIRFNLIFMRVKNWKQEFQQTKEYRDQIKNYWEEKINETNNKK